MVQGAVHEERWRLWNCLVHVTFRLLHRQLSTPVPETLYRASSRRVGLSPASGRPLPTPYTAGLAALSANIRGISPFPGGNCQ